MQLTVLTRSGKIHRLNVSSAWIIPEVLRLCIQEPIDCYTYFRNGKPNTTKVTE
jgi:hypothetical protein